MSYFGHQLLCASLVFCVIYFGTTLSDVFNEGIGPKEEGFQYVNAAAQVTLKKKNRQ